ncbi:helix-turn-helix domain-containing protein [Flammeovirga agarivorans]|uniref:Helix-turn-helix transcriptional regulator n=1 Tax=Flammeovirga agarivorans TaxID=2726742 RepID=A0A7X8SGM2_9BACT|nr:AraC family transcriptional regulator [Flammeovirga agarivorans]NLR89856.1 helix-turn-helix transcriptional regulator [Flammeovirga agarivorans]
MESNTDIIEVIDKYSTILTSQDNFGLHITKRGWKKQFANGVYHKIAFNNFTITHCQINEIFLDEFFFTLKSHHKNIVFNIDSAYSLKIKNLSSEVSLKPQDGTLFPTLNHQFITQKNTKCNFLIIEFEDSYFSQGIFHPSLLEVVTSLFQAIPSPIFKTKGNTIHLLQEMLSSTKRGVCQLMYLNGKIFEVLSEVVDQVLHQTNNNNNQYEEQVLKVKEIIDRDLHIQYSIPDLAKSVGINTSYLKKYFKETFDETIFEYATKKRISFAKNLLTTTDCTVSCVAEKVGYQHAAHFSYAFKKNTGLTPNQYRTQQK